MPPDSGQEPPLFTKTYDVVVWVATESLHFPKLYRGTLVTRLQDCAIALLMQLQAARYYTGGRARALAEADARLDQLRILLRLSKDLRLLSIQKYLSGAERLREIGKMIGGWSKSKQGAG